MRLGPTETRPKYPALLVRRRYGLCTPATAVLLSAPKFFMDCVAAFSSEDKSKWQLLAAWSASDPEKQAGDNLYYSKLEQDDNAWMTPVFKPRTLWPDVPTELHGLGFAAACCASLCSHAKQISAESGQDKDCQQRSGAQVEPGLVIRREARARCADVQHCGNLRLAFALPLLDLYPLLF